MIEINEEIKLTILPLSASEYHLLEQQIISDGEIREPLTIWQETNTLLDGHNRLEIATKHGIEYLTRYLSFDNRDAAITWVINNQLGRRNTTPLQESYYRGRRYNLEKNGRGAPEGNKNAIKNNINGGMNQSYHYDNFEITNENT